MAATKDKNSIRILLPSISKLTMNQILAGLLIIASFFIGYLWTRVQYLEKNGTSNTEVAAQQTAPQAAIPNDQGPAPVDAKVAAGIVDDGKNTLPPLGDKNAKVTLVEFSDFQCPFCRRFWKDTLPQIKKEYIDTGKVKFVYRHFPLDFHPGARPAAEGSECANEQGKFWEFHDKIFEEQEKQGEGTIQFTKDDVKKWAQDISLDVSSFNSCLDSGKYATKVGEDLAAGLKVGVSGTPTVFVNGQIVVGAQPFSAFKTVIDAAL